MKTWLSILRTGRCLAVAAILALAACSQKAAEPAAAEEEKVTPVEVAEVQTSSMSRVVVGEGVLFPFNQATVTARIPGLIHALRVNRGDRVKKGQLLAELEARDLGASVTEAQAMVAQAEAAMRSATADVSRDMAELAKEQAGLNKDSAELSKNQAELNREMASLSKDTTELNRGLAQVNKQTAELNSRKATTLPEDIRKAELDVERAAAAVDATKKALDARQDLFNQGALARRQVEEANLAYTQARTDRDAAQNHLDSLRKVGAVGQQESVKAGEAEVEGARADVEGARAQIETSRAQVEAAKAQVLGAQAQVEGTRAQVEGAKAQLEGARAQLESAKSQLDAAKARTEGALVQVSYARLASPIDGIVSERPLYEGEMAGPEKPLLTVIDVSRVIARVTVPNAQLPYLKHGDTAMVEVAGGLVKAAGKVTVIAPALDPNSSTAEVWVEIENSKGVLRPGTVVSVSIVVETVVNALVVPVGALLQSAEGDTMVLVVTPDPEVPATAAEKKSDEKKKPTGVVRETKIVVGIRESTQVQVLSGLKAGDLVVTVGGNGLEDKAKVELPGDEDEDDEEAK